MLVDVGELAIPPERYECFMPLDRFLSARP
jgi:hypothetical protein